MNIRALNLRGRDAFLAYIGQLRENPTLPPPMELLSSSEHTEPIGPIVAFTPSEQALETKLDAAMYLERLLEQVPGHIRQTSHGLWAWLALVMFDQVCPPDGNGRRKPKDSVHYVAKSGSHRRGLDKHMLFFPWKMWCTHGESGAFILSGELKTDSKFQREFTAKSWNTRLGVIRVARRLYWNEAERQLKRGATSSGKNASGTMRRFGDFMTQLDLTYDLGVLQPDELFGLLPNRITRWAERA